MPSPNDPILVVSTGRTGTVAFATNFKQRYPFAYSVHEPFGSRALRVTGNLYAANRITGSTAGLVVQTTYGLRRTLCGNQVQVECNPHMCCLLPVVRRLYPSTFIIHVVRHPVSFIRSYINHGAFSGVKGWLGHRIPFWFLRPEALHEDDWQPWDAMSPFEACAWRWSVLNEIIERDGDEWRDRYIRVRYEDLFSPDPTEWIRISSTCGLDPSVWEADPELRRMNASRPRGDSRDPSPAELAFLQDHCGAQMSRYGYTL